MSKQIIEIICNFIFYSDACFDSDGGLWLYVKQPRTTCIRITPHYYISMCCIRNNLQTPFLNFDHHYLPIVSLSLAPLCVPAHQLYWFHFWNEISNFVSYFTFLVISKFSQAKSNHLLSPLFVLLRGIAQMKAQPKPSLTYTNLGAGAHLFDLMSVLPHLPDLTILPSFLSPKFINPKITYFLYEVLWLHLWEIYKTSFCIGCC